MESSFGSSRRVGDALMACIGSTHWLRCAVVLFAALASPGSAAAGTTGTLVKFDFGAMGSVEVDLFDNLTPLSVTNFLQNYVQTNLYNNTIIHRSVQLGTTPIGSTEAPGNIGIIQGGGFDVSGNAITTAGAINLEYSRANTRGTLALARTSDPNSATSGWFFNTSDNSTGFAPNSTSAGYAVFGWVVGPGMTVVDAIAALPTFAYNSPFGELPLQNFTATDYNNQVAAASHTVVLNSVTVVKTHAAFQNPFLTTDVNNDGLLSASDLATVLSDLTIHGGHAVSGSFSGSNYLDVNGDGLVGPNDALQIIDALKIASLATPKAAPLAVPQFSAMMASPMAVVPEPSSLVLATAGVLAFGAYALRRRSRRVAGR
jgi:peptidyl-prolyl cis-trans isomerase A (cyclophilin A)